MSAAKADVNLASVFEVYKQKEVKPLKNTIVLNASIVQFFA